MEGSGVRRKHLFLLMLKESLKRTQEKPQTGLYQLAAN